MKHACFGQGVQATLLISKEGMKGFYMMDAMNNQSEIASLRQRIALNEGSAQSGLTGLAKVARHDSIVARMQRGAERILQLIEAGEHEKALALMDTEMWDVEEEKEQDGK
jgi:hypothetical protein